jgi:hypothetical protein
VTPCRSCALEVAEEETPCLIYVLLSRCVGAVCGAAGAAGAPAAPGGQAAPAVPRVNRSTWGRSWAVNARLRAHACSSDAEHTARRIWVLFFAQNPTLRG